MDRRAEYVSALSSIVIAIHILKLYDLPALIAACERAEAVGPILDPTLFKRNGEKMIEDKTLLQAALTFTKALP